MTFYYLIEDLPAFQAAAEKSVSKYLPGRAFEIKVEPTQD
jgi:hypothetical protein